MADIAHVRLNSIDYDIKDIVARHNYGRIPEIVSMLAADGFFSSDITFIECGPGKTYTSLIDAVDAATALSGAPAIIKLYEGAYDVSNASNNGLLIPDNCYIVGIGDADKIRIAGIKSSQYWSPINLTKNCGLYNIYVYAANCRYVIHDDADVHNNYSTRIIKDCIFEGSNLSYTYVYGAGLKAGSNLIIENTKFLNDTSQGAFSIHNMTNCDDVAHVTLRNCMFYVTRAPQTFPETIRLAGVMSYEDSIKWRYTYVTIEDCYNVYLTLDTEYPDPNLGKTSPFMVYGNGEWAINLSNGTLWEPQKILNGDMFFQGPSYDGSEYIGAPVFTSGSVIVKTNFVNRPPMLSDGIAMITSGVTGAAVTAVRYKGIIPLGALGISGTYTNKALTYDPTAALPVPTITEFADISGLVVIGMVNDDGFAKLVTPYIA